MSKISSKEFRDQFANRNVVDICADEEECKNDIDLVTNKFRNMMNEAKTNNINATDEDDNEESWQTFSRTKKLKKKAEVVPSGDGIKTGKRNNNFPNRNNNKQGYYRRDESSNFHKKYQNNRHRAPQNRNRVPNSQSASYDTPKPIETRRTSEEFFKDIVKENNERWDNAGDIHDVLKSSSSRESFGFGSTGDEEEICADADVEYNTQDDSTVQHPVAVKQQCNNPPDQGAASGDVKVNNSGYYPADSQRAKVYQAKHGEDLLDNLLPIFGKYSRTPAPAPSNQYIDSGINNQPQQRQHHQHQAELAQQHHRQSHLQHLTNQTPAVIVASNAISSRTGSGAASSVGAALPRYKFGDIETGPITTNTTVLSPLTHVEAALGNNNATSSAQIWSNNTTVGGSLAAPPSTATSIAISKSNLRNTINAVPFYPQSSGGTAAMTTQYHQGAIQLAAASTSSHINTSVPDRKLIEQIIKSQQHEVAQILSTGPLTQQHHLHGGNQAAQQQHFQNYNQQLAAHAYNIPQHSQPTQNLYLQALTNNGNLDLSKSFVANNSNNKLPMLPYSSAIRSASASSMNVPYSSTD